MQKWSIPQAEPVAVDILLLDSFSNHCLANLLEPLRAANDLARRTIFDWQILTLDGAACVSSSDLKILADAPVDAQRNGGLFFVVCSYGYRELDTTRNRRLLRKASRRAATVIGMDTGAWLLAGAGLLDGRHATVHWDVAEVMAETFPDTTILEQSFVVDGQLITSGGAATAFDLAQHLIAENAGQLLSLDVGALFTHDALQLGAVPAYKPESRLTAHALSVMRSAIEEPLTMRQIAERIATTQKQLERRFHDEFNASPNQVYRFLRLAAGRRLLENTRLPVSEIALRTGYHDAGAMSRAFRQQFGVAPRDLRRRATARTGR